ncbi:hypothetical protein [Microbacterium caowuchunii]|uniref:HicA-like toxin n=1 Tax=Microbacterium caowuchunii TaxID=2614638 RepID=A0A5N0TGR2_9MICO|nr:hypothetical protein [Microbacterium caowuchunii]KAA9133771.1 hypothetical protein F6B40_08455 [Microbacterium caowuchunii]
MKKELKKLVRELEAQGFTCTVTGQGHVIVRKDGAWITVFSGTPSDGRSWKNSMGHAKRAGFRPRR